MSVPFELFVPLDQYHFFTTVLPAYAKQLKKKKKERKDDPTAYTLLSDQAPRLWDETAKHLDHTKGRPTPRFKND